MNLKNETVDFLVSSGKKPEEVVFVQWTTEGLTKPSETFYCTWEEFLSVADFEYDDGYGGNEIPLSLMVVGLDWWLERGEYDGSEWWEFKTLPKMPTTHKTPKQKDFYRR